MLDQEQDIGTLYWKQLTSMVLLGGSIVATTSPSFAQSDDDNLPGPDAHEFSYMSRSHLLGTWGGLLPKLQERGVKLDLHYESDSLWNVESPQPTRFDSFNRVRGTIDIDLGQLAHAPGLTFHATAVWQAGGILKNYLGLYVDPGSLASSNTFRLGSWWFEKHWLNDHVATRVGQFAGEDSYGREDFGKSYVFSALSYALDNLFEAYESFDPFSTPAAEIRVAPRHDFYIKSMVLAEDRTPFRNNPTGLVPQFHGTPVSLSEVGFTPGKKAISSVPPDNIASRKGYSGLYKFGAAYDPGRFTGPPNSRPQSGNYLLYWMASQAIWRADPNESKGLDATAAFDWSPPETNLHYKTFSAGLRFNEPLPIKMHHTLAAGYVQTSLSPQFLTPETRAGNPERGFEVNALLHVLPMMYVQPVIQYYANVGGGTHRDVVFGFRTKVEF